MHSIRRHMRRSNVRFAPLSSPSHVAMQQAVVGTHRTPIEFRRRHLKVRFPGHPKHRPATVPADLHLDPEYALQTLGLWIEKTDRNARDVTQRLADSTRNPHPPDQRLL